MPPVDLAKIREEDEEERALGVPPRFRIAPSIIINLQLAFYLLPFFLGSVFFFETLSSSPNCRNIFQPLDFNCLENTCTFFSLIE